MTKQWVIIGSSGIWDDYIEWVFGIFTGTEEEAEKLAEKMDRLAYKG